GALTAYQMLWGGVVLLFWEVRTEPMAVRLSGTLLVIVLWLAFMESVVQFTIWFFPLPCPLPPCLVHCLGGSYSGNRWEFMLLGAAYGLVQWPDQSFSASDPGGSRCMRSLNESAEVFRRAVIGPPKKLVVTLIVLEEIYLLHS
ncbi:MAG: hypothetical protein M1318_02095, partial [Firmicutes bacterium]|nr:hypothetical protein [Bacillota bacterium]